MKKDQDIYRKIRDDALAVYTGSHPTPPPDDDKIRTLIGIFAYMTVWGDFYGEDLMLKGATCAWVGINHGVKDPLLVTFVNIKRTSFHIHANSDKFAQKENRELDSFLATNYPAALKLWAAQAAVTDLVDHERTEHAAPGEICLKALPHFVEEWGNNYRELIRRGASHERLYILGSSMLSNAQSDEGTLDRVIAEIDRSFNEVDPANPVKLELDGDFYVEDAWNARGGGWGNTITEEGGRLFGERLAKAAAILEPLYTQYPGETGTCLAMMTVELGQGQGRDRMEMWFQRAIKIDPEDMQPYNSKEYYLQPRWYGSVEDIMTFGRECVKTGFWSDKIPMILPGGIRRAAELDESIYQDPAVWAWVDIVYREYLARYPDALHYRTRYAVDAYHAGYFDIAREQLKILGKDWDRDELSNEKHAKIVAELARNVSK